MNKTYTEYKAVGPKSAITFFGLWSDAEMRANHMNLWRTLDGEYTLYKRTLNIGVSGTQYSEWEVVNVLN